MSTREWNEARDRADGEVANSVSNVLHAWLQSGVSGEEAMESIARVYDPHRSLYALSGVYRHTNKAWEYR